MRAVSTAASAARHVTGVAAQALLVAAIIAAIALALSPLYQPASWAIGTDGAAAGRGHISVPDGRFAGTTTATVNPGGSGAWVFARCYQDGVLVYGQYARVTGDNTAMLTLGPTPSWSSGTATCTAEEGTWSKSGRWQKVAGTTFTAWD